jgi:uncharacterized protein (DUF302 family)
MLKTWQSATRCATNNATQPNPLCKKKRGAPTNELRFVSINFRSLTMTLSRALLLTVLAASGAWSHAADGLVEVKSPHSAAVTMTRLEDTVKQRGLVVFARIDHAQGALKIGKTLRPTEVLIFGSPQGGTPLMECAQTAGIDLPLKALVWEDAAAQVWVGYNDPAYLAQRHSAPQCAVVDNLRKALAAITEAAVAR